MSELAVRNRQRVRAVDLRQLRRVVRALLAERLGLPDYALGLHLVSTPEMTRLNEHYLRHAGSTDVIAFDHSAGAGATPALRCRGSSTAGPALHGEIFICLDDTVAQAQRFRVAWQTELVRYVVHGVLHLRGYDDRDGRSRRRMKRKEDRLLRELSRQFRLGPSARRPRVRAETRPPSL